MTGENDLIELIEDIKSIKKSIERLELLEKPIFVQDGDKKKVLRIPDICFITTNSKGLDVYTLDNKKHINFSSISETIEEFKDDPRLMKTHKSFIVNLDNISSVKVIAGGREVTFIGLPEDITAKITGDVLEEFEKRFGRT
jgi:DNA-binding LytR/AlgR family response regulator